MFTHTRSAHVHTLHVMYCVTASVQVLLPTSCRALCLSWGSGGRCCTHSDTVYVCGAVGTATYVPPLVLSPTQLYTYVNVGTCSYHLCSSVGTLSYHLYGTVVTLFAILYGVVCSVLYAPFYFSELISVPSSLSGSSLLSPMSFLAFLPPSSICGASPLLGRLLMKRANPVALLVGASTAVILVTKLLVEYE